MTCPCITSHNARIHNYAKKLKVIGHDRTLFTSTSGLEHAKRLLSTYKQGEAKVMTPEIWRAKKIVDSTLHPGTPPLQRSGCVDYSKN